MKNILFLINNFEIGGAENIFIKQANYLNDKGFTVYFGIVNIQIEAIKNIKIKIEKFGFKNLLDISAYWRLYKFIKKTKIDIVYSTLDHANIVARFIKIFRPPVNVVIRESGMADRKSFKMKMTDIVLNFFCNKIIAVSQHVKKSLLAYQGIHARKIKVLENGVEIILSKEEIDDNMRKKSKKDVIKLVNVGSMNNDNKGQAGLIEVLRELKQDRQGLKLKLILVGSGKLKSDLESKVVECKLQDRIIFTGTLSQPELMTYYLSSDIFILNSKSEGCPNTVLEAMSFGLPVISTRVGGVTEIIEDGISGFLVDYGDKNALKEKIISLATDKNLRIYTGLKAYNRIKGLFSFNRQVRKLRQIINI